MKLQEKCNLAITKSLEKKTKLIAICNESGERFLIRDDYSVPYKNLNISVSSYKFQQNFTLVRLYWGENVGNYISILDD